MPSASRVNSIAAPGGGAGGNVPSSPNSQTLSPFGEPANKLPAEYATTYCLPSCSKMLTGAFMPAPVWNSQSFLPSRVSSAVRRPSLRPTNVEPAGRRRRAAVARIAPLLLPDERVRAHVERREDAEVRQPRRAEDAGDVALAGRRPLRRQCIGTKHADAVLRADVKIARRRIVGARRPVRAAAEGGLDGHLAFRPKRREDLAAVDEREAFGRDRERLRHERVAARVRLRRRRRLPRLLRHGAFVDADERHAVRAIEDVDPARLARLREAFAQRSVQLEIEQHDGARAVVIPDVVVDLLKVPAVFTGARVERDDRRREQVVAGAHAAVVVGARDCRSRR